MFRLSCLFFAALLFALRPSSCGSDKDEYSNSFSVEIFGGREAAGEIAKRHGFQNRGKVGNLENTYLFEVATHPKDPASSAAIFDLQRKEQRLKNEPFVSAVYRQKFQIREKRVYSRPTDPNWGKQWSLVVTVSGLLLQLNSGQVGSRSTGHDINVEPVWLQGITGKGVTVAVVDDGLWHTHTDLSPNFDMGASYDFVDSDRDVMPGRSNGEVDNHGTSCAGVIAMVKDNGVCGVGVAYNAKIAGLRLIYMSTTDAREASALGHMPDDIDIYTNSWGPLDDAFLVDGPGLLLNHVLRNGVTTGREGRGSVFIWAAGNGGHRGDSCATDGYVSSIYTIAVGAVDQNGRPAYYDEKCTSKMAVTFNHNTNVNRKQQISTADIGGGCRDDFRGTSATSPLVAGVVALALQANPTLTWRDVQYLIAYTSNHTYLLSYGEWSQNGGGLWVSTSFGFGAIDAEALVTRARYWENVPEQHQYSIHLDLRNRAVVSSTTQLDIPFTVGNDTEPRYLEHVVIEISLTLRGIRDWYSFGDYVAITNYMGLLYTEQDLEDLLHHMSARRGDISISLRSPHGTTSLLLPYRNRDFVNAEGFAAWPFMSVHHWGEDPRGEWTLTIYYRSDIGYVSLSRVKVTMYGTKTVPASVSRVPLECDKACQGGCAAIGAQYCDSCKVLRDPVTLDCLDVCPENFTVINRYCSNPAVNLTYAYTEPRFPQELPPSPSSVISYSIVKASSTQEPWSSMDMNTTPNTTVHLLTGSTSFGSSKPLLTDTHGLMLQTATPLPSITPSLPTPVDLGPTGHTNSRAAAGWLNWYSFLFCSFLSLSLYIPPSQ